MKAKELRIGNYVHAQSGKLVINKDSIYKIENINLQSAKKYEPIILTEEWLLKFGFDKLPDGDFLTYLTGLDKTLEIIVGGDGFYPQIVQTPEFSNELQHTVSLNKIEYVHELQNLFFILSGNELE